MTKNIKTSTSLLIKIQIKIKQYFIHIIFLAYLELARIQRNRNLYSAIAYINQNNYDEQFGTI